MSCVCDCYLLKLAVKTTTTRLIVLLASSFNNTHSYRPLNARSIWTYIAQSLIVLPIVLWRRCLRVYLHLHSNSRLRITWQYKKWTNSRPTLRYSRTNPIDLIDSPYAISSHDGHASYLFRDKLLRHNYSRNRSFYAPQCLECSDVDKLLRRDMLRSFHVIRSKYQLISGVFKGGGRWCDRPPPLVWP